ncbi:hypothetical protein PENTCL1PPCAC_30716, partial [Pristionchus entomophagus]
SFSENSSMSCIVLERADGSLEHLLDLPRYSAGLPMPIILTLIGDLGKAFSTLFKEGVAHRDIKLMNILYFKDTRSTDMGEQLFFKLCDFGAGRTVISHEQSFQSVEGTLPYMAPQMLERRLGTEEKMSMTAEKTDLWSLGVTLFRCFTGELPFHPSPFDAGTLLKIIQNRPTNNTIAYRDGKYYEKFSGIQASKCFDGMICMLIQLLFQQTDFERIAEFMLEVPKFRPRVIYNVNTNKLFEVVKHDSWFTDKADVGFENDARLCFLESYSHQSWLVQRTPYSSISEVNGNFLLIWDYTSKNSYSVKMTLKELQTTVDLMYEPKTVPESSASVLRQISTLQDTIINANIVVETTIELADALCVKNVDARREEARRFYDASTAKVRTYLKSLEDIDGLRSDPRQDANRKKQLVAMAKHISREEQDQEQMLQTHAIELARLLPMLLPQQKNRKTEHDLQPMLRGSLKLSRKTGIQRSISSKSGVSTKPMIERAFLRVAEAAESLKRIPKSQSLD